MISDLKSSKPRGWATTTVPFLLPIAIILSMGVIHFNTVSKEVIISPRSSVACLTKPAPQTSTPLPAIDSQLQIFDARRAHALATNQAFFQKKFKLLWFLYEPEVVCPWEQRVGPMGDGAKWSCLMSELEKKSSCNVLSFGSAAEDDFEQEIAQRTKCKISIFDPSPAAAPMMHQAAKYGAMFYPVGLGDGSKTSAGLWTSDGKPPKEVRLSTLDEIVSMIGISGQRIDVLKVDIEGHEYGTFENAFRNCDYDIGEILIELHWCDMRGACGDPLGKGIALQTISGIEKFFKLFRRCGYLVFHKEPNLQGCDGWKCLEFAFVNRTSLEQLYGR
mmetsp:Transcript_20254/g.28040  ORF Transcript_20254/g.28040 Transcript_20254/m.28040 type:complete len:332 (+) Transcript_20254:137-1132(+)|eukprot:CAMPEP_0196598808 /NCGR_PEP_ID=MMETSP1081-20130531/94519_1 /TAXON_ID=36882 /ORGANISM="Pyramimonas amylifera, Strain CCMP720" /LENGTH=331 /DNA_ID=CAMNT_0041924531 /DNA_START=688 /DNA_END=1683 /DNA_ORIENTATION=+